MLSAPKVSPVRRVARWWRRNRLAQLRLSGPDPVAANTALNAAEIHHRRTRLVSTPTRIHLMTTWLCNLRCPFCKREEDETRLHMKSLTADQRHMDWGVLEKILPIARCAQEITFTPLGEPTLHRDWDHLLDRCQELGLHNLEMTSNIAGYSDGLCEQLVRSGFRKVVCSIDSSNPETFARMRVGTTLDDVVSSLDRINEWKRRLDSKTPELVLAATFDRDNIEDLPALIDFASHHGFTVIVVQRMEPLGDADPEQDLLHHQEITVRMVNEAQRRAEAKGVGLVVHFGMINKMESLESRTATQHINSLTDLCTYPWNFIVVDVNGDVRPCCWASIKTGNLAEAPDFDAVWNCPEAQRLRADFIAGRLPGGCIDKHCGVSAKWDKAIAAQR